MNKKLFIAGNGLLLVISFMLLSAKKDSNNSTFNIKVFDKSLCYIPKGAYIFDDSMPISGKERMVSTQPFYMCNHVVTNEEYRCFLNDLKTTNPLLYTKMLPDTLVWRSRTAYRGDMIKYYFRHPSYQDYPVVGVSYEQAKEYCKWLTQRYMKDPKRKYKNTVFKLPTVYQWDWAAGGYAVAPFPWDSPYLTNKKGQRMANYRFVSEQAIKMTGDTGKLEFNTYDPLYNYTAAPEGNDAADITSPVLSYWPNKYGLYNMAGNVEQYVDEPGITKGGSWNDPAYYLQIYVEQHYKNTTDASDKIGFRVAMEIVN